MRMLYTILFLVLISGFWIACKKQSSEKSDKEQFEEILNDSRINSREVGEREGIEYFQVMKDGKTGFRDLDGNIVIEPIYESAEMFSEGLSAVQLNENDKWGYINTKGETVINPQFEYAGSFHGGLASFRTNGLHGFINKSGQIVIEPQFYWVDEFTNGLCVISTDWRTEKPRRYGYIDTTGKVVIELKFKYAGKFENGKAKVQIDKDFVYIDKTGNVIK